MAGDAQPIINVSSTLKLQPPRHCRARLTIGEIFRKLHPQSFCQPRCRKAPSLGLAVLPAEICLLTSGEPGDKVGGRASHLLLRHLPLELKLTSSWLKDILQGQQHPGSTRTHPSAEGPWQQWALKASTVSPSSWGPSETPPVIFSAKLVGLRLFCRDGLALMKFCGNLIQGLSRHFTCSAARWGEPLHG